MTIELVPDLTHILRRDPDPPSIGAYRRLVARPVDAVVRKDVSEWIMKVADHSTSSHLLGVDR